MILFAQTFSLDDLGPSGARTSFVTTPETVPLWREVLAGEQPWRRGRLFLVVIACLTLLGQILVLGYGIVTGTLEFVFAHAINAVIFWLQFYFIWIGVHWMRWLTGGWNALFGFALLIWALRDKSAVAAVAGCYALAIGCYLAFAPAVYFFAKRQKEKVRWVECFAVGTVFFLLLTSLASGAFALSAYKRALEREAREFADTAFQRIFAQHDTYFLLEHASDEVIDAPGGRDRLTLFLQNLTMHAGDVRDIEPPTCSIRFWYSFPLNLASEGHMVTHGQAEKRFTIAMQMIIREARGDWKIQAVRWYPDFDRPAPSQH